MHVSVQSLLSHGYSRRRIDGSVTLAGVLSTAKGNGDQCHTMGPWGSERTSLVLPHWASGL